MDFVKRTRFKKLINKKKTNLRVRKMIKRRQKGYISTIQKKKKRKKKMILMKIFSLLYIFYKSSLNPSFLIVKKKMAFF